MGHSLEEVSMHGASTRNRGPGWWDVAHCSRALENDYGVVIRYELRAQCPKGYQELGLRASVTAHATDEAGDVGQLVEFGEFRPTWGADTVPSVLYRLCVCQLADWLERWRKEQRVAQEALFAGE